MPRVVVCGGGLVGLSTALMLARDGHTVTVLESDPAAPPEDPAGAWADWDRPGVAQFRQPHNLLPGFQRILDAELPELTPALLAAGCARRTELTPLPPSIPDREPYPDDSRFEYVTGRRPVVEAVVAHAAEAAPGIVVRRGVKVTALLTTGPTPGAVPHVVGVRTADGETVDADLVVDATGRRSPSSAWLVALGATEPVTESEDVGFAYYSRFYRGTTPQRRSAPFTVMGTFALLTLPADNGTWSISVVAAAGDAPLRAVREPEVFERLVRSCPTHTHWLAGEPVTGVLPMAGVLDRYRRFVVDGRPVVTGFVAVGDAWACTNPSASRGLTVGLTQARLLRDTLREKPDPTAFALAWDAATERVVTPYYREQVRADRARYATMAALRVGETPPPDDADPDRAALEAAAMRDGLVFRGLLEVAGALATPAEVVARPEIRSRLSTPAGGSPGGPPAPDRGQLLALLGS